MKYTIDAHCRLAGAIGIGAHYVFDVEAQNVDEARHNAYKTHEHFGGGSRIISRETQEVFDFFTSRPIGKATS